MITFLLLNCLFLNIVEQRQLEKNKNTETNQQVIEHICNANDEDDDTSEQVITIEEDGRLGNLLMETATLLLVGQKLNKPVQLLPQVDRKLKKYFPTLQTKPIDHRKVNFYSRFSVLTIWRQNSSNLNCIKCTLHNVVGSGS